MTTARTTPASSTAAGDVDRIYRTNLSAGRAMIAEMTGGHVEVASEGAWVTSADGERFLNAGGYGVFITGARHPIVEDEVIRQLRTHPVGTRMFLDPVAARAAEMLSACTPAGLERIHFCGSGAEATEAAIKIARLQGRRRLVSMYGGYHGKTMGALSLTARAAYQKPFEPLLPSVTHVTYSDVDELEAELRRHPGEVCVIVEPVQGEAGVIVPEPGYLHTVRALCTRYGAFLVVDEIQTGLGRLGSWWGVDREAVVPDILLSGKALGGGILPVAAAICTDEAFGVLNRDPFLHTSTFSAAPLAMAAVCGALRAIKEDDLVLRAQTLGAILIPAVTRSLTRHLGPFVRAVRGRGLLIGIEFSEPGMAGEMLVELISNRVIANFSLNSDSVLRFTPPAILTEPDTEFLLAALDNAAHTVGTRYQHS
ncbi:aspartate aminotransferase family protein [Rhodococcus sp. NPDC003318]|uniref:aspartate aminotransferase family protein n=1 Tax=Rhodococcus sp. NPDC003318 TaxID=3364503 RepID=UPI003685DC0E